MHWGGEQRHLAEEDVRVIPVQTSLEQGGSRAPAGLFLSPIAATAALVSALMLERCSTVMSNGSTPAARDGGIGGGREGLTQWNSCRETCIVHLPKNPN